jgi:hypothetical protein
VGLPAGAIAIALPTTTTTSTNIRATSSAQDIGAAGAVTTFSQRSAVGLRWNQKVHCIVDLRAAFSTLELPRIDTVWCAFICTKGIDDCLFFEQRRANQTIQSKVNMKQRPK